MSQISMKLGTKIVLYISVIVLVFAAAVVGPTLYLMSNNMKQLYEEKALAGLDGANNLVEDYKQQAAKNALDLAENPAVIQAVAAKNSDLLLTTIQESVKRTGVDFVTVCDDAGIVIIRSHQPDKKGDRVLNQANVKSALAGSPLTAVENGTVTRLAARAGAPVKNAQGQIIGVVSAGYDLSKNTVVDRIKGSFKTDATFFADDVRISTTIIKDGQRVIGTKLNETIADKVLKEGQPYKGEADILGQAYVTAYMPIIGPENKPVGVIFAGQNLKSMFEQRNKLGLTVGMITLVMLLIGIGVAIKVARTITGPIEAVATRASDVACGNLALDKLKVTSNDEVGMLAEQFNIMTVNLCGLIHQIASTAEHVASASEELTASAEQSALAANEVAASVDEVTSGAEKQVIAINQTSTVIEQMASNIQQVATNANAVSDTSDRTAGAARNGSIAIQATISQMSSIERTVQTSAQIVTRLGERSLQIGQIVDSISGIAGQTNLLALNAAIEAARAGEQGRGFAVVADEVRKLAEQSQDAAKQIAELIGEIQTDTEKAVVGMNEGTREVSKGSEVVNSAGQAFLEIETLVDQVSRQIRDISTSIQQMASGSRQIVSSVRDIGDVSRTTANETQTISASIEQQSATIEEIAASSRLLAKMAEEMQVEVRKFKL